MYEARKRLSPGVSDERLQEIKEIAGEESMDEKCRRISQYLRDLWEIQDAEEE